MLDVNQNNSKNSFFRTEAKSYKIDIIYCKAKNMAKFSFEIFNNIIESNTFESIEFDFNNLKFIEPAGMMVMFSILSKAKSVGFPYKFTKISSNSKPISYGRTIGFFQKIGAESSSSRTEGETYFSPTELIISNILRNSWAEDHNIFLERLSNEIVNKNFDKIGGSFCAKEKKLVIYSIREIFRNIFDHSKSESFIYASQIYPNYNFIEIGICDLGVGLVNTVPFDDEEKYYNKNTSQNAIIKAVLPGISAYSNHIYEFGDYKNSGYGLSLVKEICIAADGSLTIVSGNSGVEFKKNTTNNFTASIPGTTIRILIDSNALRKVNFDTILEKTKALAKQENKNTIPSRASVNLNLEK